MINTESPLGCHSTKMPCTSAIHILLYFAGNINFALLRPTYQSSTSNERVASLAVDGNMANDLCSHTGPDYQAWWKVHLAFPVWVTRVEIANRHDMGKQNILFCGNSDAMPSRLLTALAQRWPHLDNRYMIHAYSLCKYIYSNTQRRNQEKTWFGIGTCSHFQSKMSLVSIYKWDIKASWPRHSPYTTLFTPRTTTP